MRMLLILGLFVISGCATNLSKIAVNPDKATIVAYSDSSANILMPLSTTNKTRIEKVNGKSVSNFFNDTDVIEVDPGDVSVEISCHILHGAINVDSKEIHNLRVVAGKRYIFRASLHKEKGCSTTYKVN